MTNDTNYRGKANAVFFAAVMVVSMFAAGFAAAPAAANPSGTQSATGIDIDAGTQNQTISGLDFDNSTDATIDISNLTAEGVDLSGASASLDGSSGPVNDVSLSGSTININLSATPTSSFAVNVTDLDASGATVASGVEYAVTQDGVTQTTNTFSIVNSANPTLVSAGQPADVSQGDTQQAITGTEVAVNNEGQTVAVTYDVSQLDNAGADTSGLGVLVNDGDITGGTVDSTSVSGNVLTVNVDTADDTNSFTIDQALVTGINTDNIADTSGLSYAVGGDVSGTTGTFQAGSGSGGSSASADYINARGNGIDVVYQGEDVYLVGSDLGNTAGATVNVRSVDSFDGGQVDSSSQEQQLTVENINDVEYPSDVNNSVASNNLAVEIDTDDLSSGDYFLRGVGSLPNNPNQEDTFEVTTQSLSADFDDDEVTDEGANAETDFEVDSNRGRYSVDVSADGDLDDEELFGIFAPNSDYSAASDSTNVTTEDEVDISGNLANTYGPFNAAIYNDTEDDSDSRIVLYNLNDRERTVDFEGVNTDDYDFEFNVTDTEASDTDSITVSERDRSASFGESVYTQTAGDVVEFTIEFEDTSDAYIQLGSEDAGFVDVLYVEDDDDDDEVTFEVNTRLLGTDVDSVDPVYNSEDDIVESEVHGGLSESPRYEISDSTTGNTFEDYLEEIDQIESGQSDQEQIVRPLQATDYDVAVNGNDLFVVNDDDETELDDEIGLATLDLTQPGIDNVRTWTAANNPADETTDLSEIQEIATQRSDIAIDDQLIIQAEASGIYGHMVQIDPDGFDALDDGFEAQTLADLDGRNGEGVNIEIEADDATGNQDPTSVNLNNDNEDEILVLVDNENGEMYIIADTSEDNVFDGSVDDGTEFTAELEYETDDEDRFELIGSSSDGTDNGPLGSAALTGDAAFPYFAAGDDNSESASTTFTLEDRDATFDNVNEDDQVEVAASEGAVVSGETNVAPGTDVSVRVRSASGVSPSFVETADDFEVSEDGTFEAELDLSSASVEDTATVNFRVAGSSIADSDALLVEETQDPASFEVSDLSPQEATATAGDSVDVSATIENTGGAEGTQDVALTLDGDELDTTEVTLGAGNSTTVEFTADTSGLDAGDYEHGVATDDDEATGTLTIEAADGSGDDSSGDDSSGDDSSGDDSSGDSEGDSSGDSEGDSSGDSEGDSTDDGTPGFGALVALVALIAAALLATRRNE